MPSGQQMFRGTLELNKRLPISLILGTLLGLFSVISLADNSEPTHEYLGERFEELGCKSTQDWGALGINTATRPLDGRKASPIRIGDKEYKYGLGHHANGEITVPLRGAYLRFECEAGVFWQGGSKGSVRFKIFVDDQKVFESETLSDSNSPVPVSIPLEGAEELRLVADNNGDGIICDMAVWANARLLRDPLQPRMDHPVISFCGRPAPKPSSSVCGFSIIAEDKGPQLAVMKPAAMLAAAIREEEYLRISIPVSNIHNDLTLEAKARLTHGSAAEIQLSDGTHTVQHEIKDNTPVELALTVPPVPTAELVIDLRSTSNEAGIRLYDICFRQDGKLCNLRFDIEGNQTEELPPPELPNLRPSIERELLEWDWRMQDGIETERAPSTWKAAIGKLLERGDALLEDLNTGGIDLRSEAAQWNTFRSKWEQLSQEQNADENQWEDLWRKVHELRRDIVFKNPLANTGPLLFTKQVPPIFSHQLTQYYGRCARPGGGLYVLKNPGRSMTCERLAPEGLPLGSYQQPDISFDGKRILFAYCNTGSEPKDWRTNFSQTFQIYEMDADGSGIRRLTNDTFDNFSPRYLPNGDMIFISTRRQGFHRCGRGPCPVYTLTTAKGDGSEPQTISFHETHEWDPAVLHDGRIVYTRWDYVDRHAVHYQQLWSVRPDGSDVRIFYGNNTFNPVGVWEARSVPGSQRVMATAAAHHAMTAGSIILLDVAKGVDGLEPIERLTQDALFPESEAPVIQWHAPVGVTSPLPVPVEQKRWPGHCYRSPYALSETYFLAAYSYESLIGEPNANPANIFGIYMMDRFGNKELLYRDLNIASLWPMPLQSHTRPPAIASTLPKDAENRGTFFVKNVYEGWPPLPQGPDDKIIHLRIIQVLPKSTPNINDPSVGLANASPGRQVLGTVPVADDGSAYFYAPAKLPLAFQALDKHGRAIQGMRSITYLQPGENVSCEGCHEHRTQAPVPQAAAKALLRSPSTIKRGPDGSKPFSYPILVQPVLERHCVSCHSGENAPKDVRLTGEPEGHYTVSYNTLVSRVPFSAWGNGGNNFQAVNSEPLSTPDYFGARGSKVMDMLLADHKNVELTAEEIERLVTWMDNNALFYGTFDKEDQARQQRGERIAGPALE